MIHTYVFIILFFFFLLGCILRLYLEKKIKSNAKQCVFHYRDQCLKDKKLFDL